MNPSCTAIVNHYVDYLALSGDVLEIGGHHASQSAAKLFSQPRWNYHDLNLRPSDIPETIVADITDCRAVVSDESFDLVVSSSVFEHIDRPWLAAAEISRILKPGGLAITWTVWAWRYHPCPIDYWRFSPDCLSFLFADLDVLETAFDLRIRRHSKTGRLRSGQDSVPLDKLGGWREHWGVYCVARKGDGPAVPLFKHSDHPLAPHMRADTVGTVTNPKLRQRLGLDPPKDSESLNDTTDGGNPARS
jgi:SAM-dependent methyltransferase